MPKAHLTRRQHLVSRFHLRRFADQRNQLLRVALPGTSRNLVSLNDASVVKDFYTVETPAGELTDFFEKQFAVIEGPASEAFLLMLDEHQWPMKGDHRLAITTWIALQYLRSERVRASQNEMMAQIIKLIVGVSGKEALRKHIEGHEAVLISDARLDAEWSDLTKPGGPTLKSDARHHIHTMYNLLEPTAQMLAARQWTMQVFSRRRLMTCDHPVSLHVGADYPDYRGVGLATADGFLVPMSRAQSLLIGPSFDAPDLRIPGTTRLAQAVNFSTLANSRKCVYWHPDDSAHFAGMPMPEPQERETDDPIQDDFVQERGLFADMSDEAKGALSRGTRAMGGQGSSFSLNELPWPIPRRVFHWPVDQA